MTNSTLKASRTSVTLYVLWCSFAGSAFAGQVTGNAEVYEKPSTSSKLIETVSEGTHLHVTGERMMDDGTLWNSVILNDEPANRKLKTVKGSRGSSVPMVPQVIDRWINSNSITVEEGDAGYVKPIGFRKQVRYFAGGGIGELASQSHDFTGRLTAGVDFLIGQSRSVFELMLAKPISSEAFPAGTYQGGIHRFYFMPGYGYFLVPEQLMIRGSIGLGYLSGDSQYIDAKIKPSFGAGIRYLKDYDDNWGFGVEASYEYSGNAYKAISDPGNFTNLPGCNQQTGCPNCGTWNDSLGKYLDVELFGDVSLGWREPNSSSSASVSGCLK